jgi:AbrB family looped-hinge helix DNA binding protein
LGLTTNLDVDEKVLEENDQYFGISKVGERGQIVIPQKARELFKINSGDLILVFGHIKKGLGFIKASKLKDFAVKLFQAFGGFEGMKNDDRGDKDEKE